MGGGRRLTGEGGGRQWEAGMRRASAVGGEEAAGGWREEAGGGKWGCGSTGGWRGEGRQQDEGRRLAAGRWNEVGALQRERERGLKKRGGRCLRVRHFDKKLTSFWG